MAYEKRSLYKVFVPTIYGDTLKPISTKHHKSWDKKVYAITGGLTINPPCKGKWIDKKDKNREFFERVIPVEIMCSEKDIMKIIEMTGAHYRQRAVMYYLVTEEVQVVEMRK